MRISKSICGYSGRAFTHVSCSTSPYSAQRCLLQKSLQALLIRVVAFSVTRGSIRAHRSVAGRQANLALRGVPPLGVCVLTHRSTHGVHLHRNILMLAQPILNSGIGSSRNVTGTCFTHSVHNGAGRLRFPARRPKQKQCQNREDCAQRTRRKTHILHLIPSGVVSATVRGRRSVIKETFCRRLP